MNEGADLVTQETCGNTTTLVNKRESDATTTATQPSSPPSTTTYTGRRPRCGTGRPPPSPYMWIDGRRLRSALIWEKKPPKESVSPRRVSFPTNDSHLVTGYLEPANPWRHAENVSHDNLVSAYKESCARHNTEPLQNVLVQIENLDISQDRCEDLSLEGENLDQHHCEPLEEILKRVQFNKINLESTSLDDESSIILFDMLEYYESTKSLNISSNPNIGPRGWQACSYMVKKTQCLEQLEARDIMLNEQYMNILSRALRLVCHLHVLKLENCGLSGRAIVILVTALKLNSGIRELYLADNGLDLYDAIQLGSLLRMNNHLQLLDISNNNVQDDGVRDILEGLINQVNEDKTGKGLSILILWNNRLTKKASPYISRLIALSKTLETLNIGQNMLTDETLSIVNESLKRNRVLLQLGMQSTELTCDGIITLAEVMEANQVLQRIDLRDNSIQMRGMQALVNVMKKNKSITQIDLDDKPRIRIDGPLHQYMNLVAEIRSYCNQNEQRRLLEGSNEDIGSPQHSSRLPNASSRKISLTCQTLPSPSRTTESLVAAVDEPAARNMLEPKRTSGGRLRSPAPSPIPSPVASPIPSPSRNRFVVCRVPEASLRSTDSSASSSPLTPPSLGSSPTCFFSGTSSHGTSRFRVSVVESVSASHASPPRSVVTSPSGNVTIGFNFKTSVDSDDPDSMTKANTKMQDAADNATASVDTLSNVVPIAKEMLSFCDDINKNEDNRNEEVKGKEMLLDECDAEMQFAKDIDAVAIQEVSNDDTANESNIAMDVVNVTAASGDTEMIGTVRDHRIVYTSTKELHVPAYSCEDIASSEISIIKDRALNNVKESSLDDTATEPSANPTSENFSSSVLESSTNTTSGASSDSTTHSQEQTSTSVQRHKSSLEKLMSLFQYPGNFFADTTSVAMDTRTCLQENVSSVMTLGDRLQQYLKEGRAKVSTDSSSWFSQHGSPLKNKSAKLNVSQLQNLTDIFASFKLEPQRGLADHGTKSFSQTKNEDAITNEKDKQRSSEIARDDEEDLLCQEENQIAENEKQDLCGHEFTEANAVKNSGGQRTYQIATDDESNLFDKEKDEIVGNDKEECVNLEANQRIANDEKDFIDQEKNQVTRNDKNNLFDQEQEHIVKDDENDLAAKEENEISENGKTDLFDLDKCQIARNNEQMLADQFMRNEKDVDQEKSEPTNNENNLFDQVKNSISTNDKKNLVDSEEQVAREKNEDFEIQENNRIIEISEDLQDQIRINQDEHELKDQEDTVAKDLEDWGENKLADNGEKDSTDARDLLIDAEENAYSVCKLQWTESNSNRDEQSLFKTVQLKDGFADKDLVLGDVSCVAMTNTSSSTTCKFTTCLAENLTNILEYSVLELGQVDTGLGCNDAKRFSSNDENPGEPSDDTQDLKFIEHNNIEHSERDDLQGNVGYDETEILKHDEAKVLEYDNEKCSKRDDAVEEANARRTCDTTTTDSINQTSDNSFPICNITCNRKVVDSVNTVSMLAMSSAIMPAPENCGILSTSLINVGAEIADTSDSLNDEVTSGMRRINEDRKCDFTWRKEEEGNDTVKVLDDVCRDSAHHISTSVNTKVEPQISAISENQDIHRTILKNAAVTDDYPEDTDDKCNDPTIFIMPYEMSDKSDADELIFCITDISTDGTSVEDELSPSVVSRCSPNDVTSVTDSYFELPTTTPMTTTTTLLIDNPEGMHRNSQDSGIDETALAIDDTVAVDAQPLPPARGSLQESIDSGIESECSSICVRMESAVELETAPATKRLPRRDGAREQRRDNGDDIDDDGDGGDDGDDGDDFFDGEFASDFLAKETLLIDNDSVSDIARSYLNSIKSAVVSTPRPVIELPSSAPLGVVVTNEDIALPTAAVIAHSPAAVHGTSPK